MEKQKERKKKEKLWLKQRFVEMLDFYRGRVIDVTSIMTIIALMRESC